MAYTPPDRVFGVDFSGAKDAGKKVWVAEIDATETPRLVGCAPATERFDVEADRVSTHRALTQYVGSLAGDAAVGFDFPFALPETVVSAENWVRFLREFPGQFASPAELQRRYDGVDSLRLSFLLSIPAALGAGVLAVLDTGVAGISPGAAVVALAVSGVVGYLTVGALVALARRVAFWWICIGFGSLAVVGGALLVL